MRRHLLWILLVLGVVGCGDDSNDSQADSTEAKCDELVAVATSCIDNHCATTSNASCDCWNQGMDIDMSTCACTARNMAAACDLVDLDAFDPSLYDCSATTNFIDALCTAP